jgi:hypothetical protein
MKKIVLFILIVALFSGCTGGGSETEYETDEGTVKVSSGSGGPDWCKEGAGWEMALGAMGGTESLKFEGLVESGEYEGLCHVFVQRTDTEGETRIDYYFDEEMQDINVEHYLNGELVFSGSLNELIGQMTTAFAMDG